MERIYSLQILRFVAAFMVVISHAFHLMDRQNLLSGPHANREAFGVDIFFVLSGAVIYHQCSSLRPAAGDFFRQRLLRIVPAYWIATVACAVALAVHQQSIEWQQVATSLVFWPIWPSDYWFPVLAVGWTLCFEMLFYSGAAIVLRWGKWAFGFLILAFTLFAALGFADSGDAKWLRFLGNPLILEFLFGVGGMALYQRFPSPRWLSLFLIAIGVVILALGPIPAALTNAAIVKSAIASASRVLLAGVPSLLIVYGTLGLKFRRGVLIYLGDASYSIYLAHWVVFWALYDIHIGIAGFVLASLAAGIFLHEVDKRFRSRLRPLLGPSTNSRQTSGALAN